MWSSACSTPSHHATESTPAAATSSPPTDSANNANTPNSTNSATAVTKLCFAAMPHGWTSTAGSATVASPAGVTFSLNAVDGTAGYGTYRTSDDSGVGRLDLETGHLTRISPISRDSGGVGWISADGPWVVWEQLDSQSNLLDWSVHVWNQTTGHTEELATSRAPDGAFYPGQQALPVVDNGRVAWAQPVRSADGKVTAELRVVELATGKIRTLDTGRISSPVHAGTSLIWAAVDTAGAYTFHAVDADSLAPAPLPPELARPDSIGFLAGSPDYLAWSSQDETRMTVWRLGAPSLRVFGTGDGRHFFQFMQITGHFVLWFNSSAYSVLDVDTGGAFDVQGTAAGGQGWIAVAAGNTTISRIPTAKAQDIVACA